MSPSSSINLAPTHFRLPLRAGADVVDGPSGANLLGLGVALPQLIMQPDEVERALAMQWRLRDEALDRWRRICRGAGIERRYGVLSLDEVITLSTAERMGRYELLAPPLAERAARDALNHAGVIPERITDLVVVSCTGFASPGLDVALIRRLGLRNTVRRTMIGFMGCFGAINGLRSTVGTSAADPSSISLVVCCELCSLHVRDDPTTENQVACALFGDGAAAAVVAGDAALRELGVKDNAGGHPIVPFGQLTFGDSCLLPASEELMSWRITDSGFAMTLSREVPGVLREAIASFVLREGGKEGDALRRKLRTIVPHPGGPGVLDAIESALPPRLAPGIRTAREVLRTCGNMSSGTVLFALERLIRNGCECGNHGEVLPVKIVAFGPGLTMESIELT